jgi:hypothetical protein
MEPAVSGCAGALAEWVTALATLGLLVVALWQIPLIRKRYRETETLRACQIYDTDPVIEAASLRAWRAAKNGEDYSQADKRDVIVVMNYFDGLAIGIEQGLYEEQIVRDHAQPIIDKLIKVIAPQTGVGEDLYPKLFKLQRTWSDNQTAYKSRWWR